MKDDEKGVKEISKKDTMDGKKDQMKEKLEGKKEAMEGETEEVEDKKEAMEGKKEELGDKKKAIMEKVGDEETREDSREEMEWYGGRVSRKLVEKNHQYPEKQQVQATIWR